MIGKLISSVLPRGTVKGMLYEATFAATCVSSKTALCETKHVCSYASEYKNKITKTDVFSLTHGSICRSLYSIFRCATNHHYTEYLH